MQAMILAAGFGTRLLPYTQYKPKPLFPVLNIPLIILAINRLRKYGFDRIIVNCHHLRPQMKEVLAGLDGIVLQEEDVILGTGGGLRKTLDKIRNEPLLVINSDIYHTVDCKKLYEQHLQSNAQVTMAVHDYPRFNTLYVKDNRLQHFADSQNRGNMAFTGIHVVDPEVLEPIVKEKKSCIIERYTRLLQDNPKTFTIVPVDGCFWTDMGTPADYLKLQGDILQRNIPLWPELRKISDSPFCIDSQCSYDESFQMKDWACIGRCTIGRNVKIIRSVIWDGADVPDNSRLKDTIFVKK